VKQMMSVICIAMFSLALFAGCTEDTPKTDTTKPSAQTAPATQAAPATPAAPASSSPGKSGKVVETMDSAGYTYVHVDTGTEQIWAAAPQFAVKVGDDVLVPEGMPMPNYHSNTLDRDFEMVYFVPTVMVGGASDMAGNMPAEHPPMTGGGKTVVESTDVDLTGITVVEGGQSVADIFAKKAELTGKPVKVRGKVVKFSPQIMGKNWIHIQDGTGEAGSNDLTVTTNTTANVGDTVVISGVLTADKDFGYGYQYSVLVEDAEVTTE
jgi:hypothetical protein